MGESQIMFEKLRRKLHYTVLQDLYYTVELKEAYSGGSVTGGNLVGKNVLITGATGDLGYSLSLRFIDEGCNVILAGRNMAKLNSLKKQIDICRKNAKIYTILLDLLDQTTIKKSIDELYNRKLNIDILVNNAGFFTDQDRDRVFRKYDMDTYKTSWQTNYEGTTYVAKVVAEKMSQLSQEGCIIFVSSICAQQKKYKYTPYGMSKSAIYEFAKLLQNLYPSLSVNTIFPGSIATKMGNISLGDNIARANNKLNHLAMPEEISALVAFLCSEKSFIKGEDVTASACEIF